MKNTNQVVPTSEVRAEQVTNVEPEAIYLGLDLHKKSISVTRILDHSTAQPAQRFDWEKFRAFARKQLTLAKKVHAVYEAGAFGFKLQRDLQAMGIECKVCHPEKLDPRHKRVQTDKLDSGHLAERLRSYVLGNRRAMTVVYVPSPEEEQRRHLARHRQSLSRQLHSHDVRGQGLLLSQGFFSTRGWWLDAIWKALQPKVSPQLAAVLEDIRAIMKVVQEKLEAVEKALKEAAPKVLPKGMGPLTFELLLRQICNYQRFKNRRNVGGFTGLCGGVSSSGDYHLDLSINKAGDPSLRMLLIELIWRMIYWQPGYIRFQRWKRELEVRSLLPKRQRKIIAVALAHQLMVDIWRWQTGRTTPEKLGWIMTTA